MLDSFYGGRPGSQFVLSGSFKSIYTGVIIRLAYITENSGAALTSDWLFDENNDLYDFDALDVHDVDNPNVRFLIVSPGPYQNKFYAMEGTSEDFHYIEADDDIGMIDAFSLGPNYTGIAFGEYCLIDEGDSLNRSQDHGRVFYRGYDYDNLEKRITYKDGEITAYGAEYIGNFSGPLGNQLDKLAIEQNVIYATYTNKTDGDVDVVNGIPGAWYRVGTVDISGASAGTLVVVHPAYISSSAGPLPQANVTGSLWLRLQEIPYFITEPSDLNKAASDLPPGFQLLRATITPLDENYSVVAGIQRKNESNNTWQNLNMTALTDYGVEFNTTDLTSGGNIYLKLINKANMEALKNNLNGKIRLYVRSSIAPSTVFSKTVTVNIT